jgi:hypothetical protein
MKYFRWEMFRDQATKRPAVAVLDPAIGADEPETSARSQKRQRLFNERHIDICAIEDRRVAPPVFGHQHIRDQLLPHIGRVADHVRKFPLMREQQEISLLQPTLAERFALCRRHGSGDQHICHQLARVLVARAMQLDGRDAITEVFDNVAPIANFPRVSPEQPFNRRRQEIRLPH